MSHLLRIGAMVCALASIAAAASVQAQGGNCHDPWINSAFNQIYHRAPQGNGYTGECNINLYGGGHWSDYQDLSNKVLGSKFCADPWIGEAYIVAMRRRPSANECSPANYGGGRWSGFDDLVAKVQQYQRQIANGQAAPPPQTPRPSAPLITPTITPNVSAAACRDAWITSAFNQIYHRAPQGSGNVGECNVNLYGGGHWSDFQDLSNKVLGSKYCQDAWIGEAYVVAVHRRPSANECWAGNYGGGHWSSFDDLVAKVQQYQRQNAGWNRPPVSQPIVTPNPGLITPGQPARPANNFSVTLVSRMGSKCLDVEGGRSGRGTRLIGYACNGQRNQQFQFNPNGTLTQNGLCVDAASGLGRDGDQIQLWDCNGGANQRWQRVGDQLVGINGKCIDLKGGRGWWFGNQPATLWACNGQENQRWLEGVVIPASRVHGIVPVQPGVLTPLSPVNASAGVIAVGGANVIAAGGANVIASGGANVIAVGGANVIAAGGANVIAAGGANVIVLAQQ